jgi:hypothetical protein
MIEKAGGLKLAEEPTEYIEVGENALQCTICVSLPERKNCSGSTVFNMEYRRMEICICFL